MNRHADMVRLLLIRVQAHVHGDLMVQRVQLALLGGAFRLCDLVKTLSAGCAPTVPPHHKTTAMPKSARRFRAKHS